MHPQHSTQAQAGLASSSSAEAPAGPMRTMELQASEAQAASASTSAGPSRRLWGQMRMACLMLARPSGLSPRFCSSGQALRTLGAHAAAEPAQHCWVCA